METRGSLEVGTVDICEDVGLGTLEICGVGEGVEEELLGGGEEADEYIDVVCGRLK